MAGLALGISLTPVFYPTLTHIYNKKASEFWHYAKASQCFECVSLAHSAKGLKNDKTWFYSKVNAKEMPNGTAHVKVHSVARKCLERWPLGTQNVLEKR